MITAFIINYQRLTLPARMADYLAEYEGVTPVIVDNASDYPPLLEYYKTTPHKVVRLNFNFGQLAVYHPASPVFPDSGVLPTERFIVTDPDLLIDHMPGDWLQLLHEGLDKYDFATKAGFSLRTDDLPNTPIGNAARAHEASAWISPLENGRFYRAYIDTTFSLLRGYNQDFPAVRTGPPYTAIHVPWYYKTLADVPEDELYYMRSTLARGSTDWTIRIREALGA